MYWNVVLGQMRHDKSRSVRRVEGIGVCSWIKRSVKSRHAWGKMDVLDCIEMCVFWVKCVMKSRDQFGELKVLECVFGSRSARKVEMLAVKWRF